MEYIIIIILLLFCAIKYDGDYKDNSKLYWLVCFGLILFVGLRYRIGGDSMIYMDNFKYEKKLQNLTMNDFMDSKYAPLWVIFSSFCKTLFNDFTALQLIHSFFVNIVIFWFFKKHLKFKFTAVLFYFYLYYLYYNTEVLRAAVATAFFLLSYDYYKNGKWLQYYILSIIAFLFHFQAVVLFLLPLTIFLRKISFNVYSIILLVIIAVSVQFAFNFVPIIKEAVSDFEHTLYLVEYYSEGRSIYNSNLNGIIMHIIYQIPYLYLLWYNRNSKDKEMYCIFVAFIIFSFMGLSLSTIMNRSKDLLGPVLIVVMARSLEPISKHINLKYLSIISVVLILFWKIDYYIFAERYKLWYPYSSVFDKNNERDKEHEMYLMRIDELSAPK